MSAVLAIRLTAHAQLVLQRRQLKLEWVEETLSSPTTVREDERDPSLILAFKQIPEAGDKWLRVVYRRDKQTYVVVTAFFDRNQENGR